MDKHTIIRTIVLGVALINLWLESFGYSPLPFDEEVVSEFISNAFVAVAALIAWWKNNDFTHEAAAGTQMTRMLKKMRKKGGDE